MLPKFICSFVSNAVLRRLFFPSLIIMLDKLYTLNKHVFKEKNLTNDNNISWGGFLIIALYNRKLILFSNENGKITKIINLIT